MHIRGRRVVARVVVALVVAGALNPAPSAVAAEPASWSQYRGDSQRTGFRKVDLLPQPALAWSLPVTGGLPPMVDASPVVAKDGTVYFATVGTKEEGGGTLYAVNPDGTLKWTVLIQGYYVRATPAVRDDGTIVVPGFRLEYVELDGDGIYTTDDRVDVWGRVFLVGSDGSVLTSSAETDGMLSSPLVSGETARLGFWSRKWSCHAVLTLQSSFEASTRCGSRVAGFESDIDSTDYCPFGPCPAEGGAAAWGDPDEVARWASTTGDEASPILSLAMSAAGTLFGTTPFWQTWAMNATTGERLWQNGTHGRTTPAVGAASAYVGTDSNVIVSWSEKGGMWKLPPGGMFEAPAVAPSLSEVGVEWVFGHSDCGIQSFRVTGSLNTAEYMGHWTDYAGTCPDSWASSPAVVIHGQNKRMVAYAERISSADAYKLLMLTDGKPLPVVVGSVTLDSESRGSPAVAMITSRSGTSAGRIYVATEKSLYALGVQ